MATIYTAKSKRELYEQQRSSLWTQRTSGFDSHWRELGEFLLPRRTRFWTGDVNRGDKRNQNIIDSTGRYAARTLSSGLHAGLTSPARPWMKLSTPDPDLAKMPAVKEWLSEVTTRMLTVFEQSNLYNALPIMYGDIGVFGTAACAILKDRKDLFRAFPYPVGSYVLALDDRGVATTFIREYELSVMQVVTTFAGMHGLPLERGETPKWDNISSEVKTAWERGDYQQRVPLCWIVQPNDEADDKRFGSKYLPWTSCHWEKGATGAAGSKFLRESGFESFPILAPRWDVNSPEDTYGTDCPGMTALGDIKQLQIQQRIKGRGITKQVDPPMTGPSSLRTQKVSTLPGEMTYVDVREGQQGFRSAYDVQINLADMTADIREVQYRIDVAFYVDLFRMLQQRDQAGALQPITAREVEERHEEKLIMLGPVLERTNDELLEPLIDRVYTLMEQAGLLPDAPPDLDGVKLKVEFISILAQAQKSIGVGSQDRFLQSVSVLAQTFPQVKHKIRPFKVVDLYAEMLGVDPSIIAPTDEAEESFEAEQQAAQAAAQAEQAKTLADAAQMAGNTPVGTGSLLDAMGQGAPAGSV